MNIGDNMVTEEQLSKLRKLQSLAERGMFGEKEVAQARLNEFLTKYNVSLEDLEPETIKDYWFAYNKALPYNEKLLGQVIYAVLGECKIYHYGRKHGVGVECTPSQAVEIETMHTFYYEVLRKEMKLFFDAFLHKNDIFPPDEKKGNVKTKRDDADIKQMLAMMGTIEKHHVRKQLSN